MSSPSELLELSRQLKQERLFVGSEREQLQTLNEDVSSSAQRLYHLAWITRQQRQNLDQLLRADKAATPEACCEKANNLDVVNFVDGYRHLTYHESKIGECLKLLRENPRLIASSFIHSEKNGTDNIKKLAQIIMTGMYGNGVMPQDENLALQVIKYLIELQVAVNDNPRRLLRKGSCSFYIFFKLLNEGLFSAKLFLTAAFHTPIMQLLMEDEWFYDIDPDRALYRFPNADRVKRFGEPGTDDYKTKTKNYRDMTNSKLYLLTEHFITSLQANMYCFPQSLAWLCAQLYKLLTKSGKCDQEEARAICADLIFTTFICPAICDPEPFGITSDAPISYIARHNLMQVAQILQMLAISSSLDSMEPKVRDLYGKFSQGILNFVLDSVLDAPAPELPAFAATFQRAAVFMTMTQLLDLLSFLRAVEADLDDDSPEKKQLVDLLTNLPSPSVLEALHTPHHLTPNTTPQPTPPGTPPRSVRKMRSAGKDLKRLLLTPDSSSAAARESDDEGDSRSGHNNNNNNQLEEVLVISLGVVNECPGMMHEAKVLEQETKKKRGQPNSLIPGEDDPISESEINLNQKRTRFSLSHDQDSIATSDNLEAISEAASSHSVGSDLENEEDDNDNLSDFVSANVSGRGTPSISGRDTPLSQVESVISQEQGGAEEPQRESRPPVANLPVIVQKQNREDVTDRFGKFEIKQELERYEIKSTVSDTWSTDVLASDSEPPDQNQLERLEEVAEEMIRRDLLGVQLANENSPFPDVSETASDAWSTDVLASDTSEKQVERLLELEQDEMSSVSSRSHGGLFDDYSSVGSRSQGACDQDDMSSVGSRSQAEADDTDDTPQPPGSPAADALGASAKGDNKDNELAPLVLKDVDRTRSNLMKSDRFSDPGLFRHSSADKNPNPSPRPTSEVLESFDPLQSRLRSQNEDTCSSASSQSRASPFKPYSDLSDGGSTGTSGNLGSSAVTLVAVDAITSPDPIVSPDLVTSPDQGIASSIESVKTASATSLLDDSTTSSAGNSRPDSGVEAVDIMAELSNELADGLKLTEFQNVRLDAHRFSEGLIRFDPLLQDVTVIEPIQRLRIASEPTITNPTAQSSSSSSSSRYNPFSQGARPKIPVSQQNSAPIKISVNDLEVSGSPAGRPATRVSNGPMLVDLDSGGDMVASSAAQQHKAAMAAGADTSITEAKSDTGTKEDDEKEKKKGSSGGSGLLRSFKERFSKGPFTSMPTLSMRAPPAHYTVYFSGKRKLPQKPLDKDEGKLIEIEKGSGDSTMKHGHSSSEDLVTKGKSTASSKQQADDSVFNESSDDILAKYRRPTSSPTKAAESGSSQDVAANQSKEKEVKEEETDAVPAYDPSNLENCKAFVDAKKKLRLVLCSGDLQASPWLPQSNSGGGGGGNSSKENDLVLFLKAQLAESINLQDKDTIAQLHETIRCLRMFDSAEVKKLIKAMKEEYRLRAPYISYLVRCRQGLLTTIAHLERLHNRVHRDKAVVNKYFLSVFVRLFMEKRERQLMRFIAEFQRLTMPDEKTDLVEQFLRYMNKQMEQDAMWKAANEHQMEEARLYIERNVMSHIYTHAMYPNGDGDIMRDKILNEHIRKLSSTLSPGHKDLCIPKLYHYECPWPAAQADIYMINAYKTPKDKLQCVWKCSQTIMNLLRLASDKSVPAADDFMPVLIYVIIKANPPSLMSTVQYVNSFYDSRLHGEEQYWWVQFTSAIEFIKTMD